MQINQVDMCCPQMLDTAQRTCEVEDWSKRALALDLGTPEISSLPYH